MKADKNVFYRGVVVSNVVEGVLHPSDLLLLFVRFSFMIYSHIKEGGQASDGDVMESQSSLFCIILKHIPKSLNTGFFS